MTPTEPAVAHFQEELSLLKTHLLSMGRAGRGARPRRDGGAVDRDRGPLREVEAGDEPVNRLHVQIDSFAFKLLALHQPVVADLRAVVAAIKINSDLDASGTWPSTLPRPPAATSTTRRSSRSLTCREWQPSRRACCAMRWICTSGGTWASPATCWDATTDSKTQIFRELLSYMLEEPAKISAPALELIRISRHFERIGDHATNVAEDVIFMVSAEDVRHAVKEPGI